MKRLAVTAAFISMLIAVHAINAQGSAEIRLGLSRGAIPAGGRVGVRIENRGNQDLAYGYFYELEKPLHGSWTPLPSRHQFAPRLSLPAGSVTPWQYVHIPRHAIPGWYRIKKSVETEAEKTIRLQRAFRVYIRRKG